MVKLDSLSNNYTRLINPYILKNIYRYSDRLTNIQENVAEHSFFTALILCELLENSNANDTLIAKALSAALRHDVLEAVLTDIPHSTKDSDEEFNIAIEKAEAKLRRDNSEDKAIHTLVKIADILQVIQFIFHEKKLGNLNDDIISIEKQSRERLQQEMDKLKDLYLTFNLGLFTLEIERLLRNEFAI